jgi:hypothetical protein
MGKGLANLKSLEHFNITFDEESSEEETNAVERTFRIDCDGTLAIVLPHLRQKLLVDTFGDDDYEIPLEEVKALARAIRGHPTINGFYTSALSEATFHCPFCVGYTSVSRGGCTR